MLEPFRVGILFFREENKVIFFESFSLSLVTAKGSRGKNKFNEENKEISAGLQEGISMKPAAYLQLLQSSGGSKHRASTAAKNSETRSLHTRPNVSVHIHVGVGA